MVLTLCEHGDDRPTSSPVTEDGDLQNLVAQPVLKEGTGTSSKRQIRLPQNEQDQVDQEHLLSGGRIEQHIIEMASLLT